MIQDNFGEGFTIECEGDVSIYEERANPVAERQCKAQKGKDMDNAADMEIVKEALNVEEEETSHPSAFDASLDCVCHAEDCVSRCMIIPQAELASRKEVKMCSI